jgi:hypothetical protein
LVLTLNSAINSTSHANESEIFASFGIGNFIDKTLITNLYNNSTTNVSTEKKYDNNLFYAGYSAFFNNNLYYKVGFKESNLAAYH